jgi:hypothetical protein
MVILKSWRVALMQLFKINCSRYLKLFYLISKHIIPISALSIFLNRSTRSSQRMRWTASNAFSGNSFFFIKSEIFELNTSTSKAFKSFSTNLISLTDHLKTLICFPVKSLHWLLSVQSSRSRYVSCLKVFNGCLWNSIMI